MERFWRQFSIGCVVGLALIGVTVIQAGRQGVIQRMTAPELAERAVELAALVLVISGVFAWARLVEGRSQGGAEPDHDPQSPRSRRHRTR